MIRLGNLPGRDVHAGFSKNLFVRPRSQKRFLPSVQGRGKRSCVLSWSARATGDWIRTHR